MWPARIKMLNGRCQTVNFSSESERSEYLERIQHIEELKAQLRLQFIRAAHAGDDGVALEALEEYLFIFGSRERVQLFIFASRVMPDRLFWPAFHSHWNSFDAIPHVQFARLLREHRPSWRKEFMNADDVAAFAALPIEFTVYRGQAAAARAGLSWILDRRVAEHFARGLRGVINASPVVVEAVVRKPNVASLRRDLNESEILLFCASDAKRRTVHPFAK